MLFDGKVGIRRIREDNAQGAAVIAVDDAGEGVDTVLESESGAGCYSAVYVTKSC